MADDFQSARTIDLSDDATRADVPTFMISADSHATEPASLWKALPAKIRERLPLNDHPMFKRPEGASDPHCRVRDMDVDHVAAEILFPDRSLAAYRAEPDVQLATFRLYNDWLADYCKASPKRLFGVAAIPAYDIDEAIREMQRANGLGLYGALLWEVPPQGLGFDTPHYEKLWSAAEELGAPINLHVLTGFNYSQHRTADPTRKIREQVNVKTHETNNALFDFVWSGVFDRHPRLKLGLIESEIGWLPFLVQQWDYYYGRNARWTPEQGGYKIGRPPGEIVREHVYATFMDDYVGGQAIKYWGEHNVMWSSDYPHPNMTWPNSRAFLARQLGALDPVRQKRVLSQNVIDLYKLKL